MKSYPKTKNEAVVQFIIYLLNAYKGLSLSNLDKADTEGLRYLLGQTIRQYNIPEKNRHLSQEARKRWNQLTTDDIKNYHYRKKVTCDNLLTPIQCELYNGANGKGKTVTLSKGDTFLFREMFHEDHVIPVSLILNEMLTMKTVNKTAVKGLLNPMHVCVMLKEEDRRIGRTKGRTLDFNKTIKDVYNKACIKLC